MILIRKFIPFIVVVAFMVPGFLADAAGLESTRQGDKSLCKIGDELRRVEIHYYEQEKAVPCEVHYYKETEEPGEDRVLWRAENQTGYCENKMSAFVDELSGLGWLCESEADIPPADIPPALQLEGNSQ